MRRTLLFTCILIIGAFVLLALITTPICVYPVAKARINATKMEIRVITTALDTYEMDNNCFPATEQGLNALLEKPTIPPIPENWTGPYLSENILDIWKNPYQYRYPSLHNMPYDIWSFGPDGKDGTDDDLQNWDMKKVIYVKANTTPRDIIIGAMIGIVVALTILWIFLLLKKPSQPTAAY